MTKKGSQLLHQKRPKEMASNGSDPQGGGGVWGVPYILMRHIIVRPALWSLYIVCLDTTSIIRNCTFVLKPHLLVATSAWQPGIFVRKDRKRNGNSQKMLRVSLTLIIITSFNITTSSKGKKIPRCCWKCIFNPIILWLPTWKASNSLQLWNQKDSNHPLFAQPNQGSVQNPYVIQCCFLTRVTRALQK